MRRAWLWPVLPCVLAGMHMGGGSKDASLHQDMASYMQGALAVILIVLLLLGLSHGRDERERKTNLAWKALPLSHLEELWASWLALAAYGTLIAILSLLAYIIMHRGEALRMLTAKDSRRNSIVPVISRQGEISGEWMLANRSLKSNETLAVRLSINMPGQGPSGLSRLKTTFYWTDGQQTEKMPVELQAERISVVPPGNAGLQRLIVPRRVQSRMGEVELVVHEVYLHRSGLPFAGLLAGYMLNMLLKLFLFAGLVTSLGKKLSMESGAFVVISLFCLGYIFSVLGEGAIEKTVQTAEKSQRKSSQFTSLWWEKGLLLYTKTLAPLQKAGSLFSFPDDAAALSCNHWVRTPLSGLDVAAPFVVVFLLVLLSIPATTSRWT